MNLNNVISSIFSTPSSSVDVIVGGQFGSESKGRVTHSVIQERLATGRDVVSIRVAGPNAGHVVVDRKGDTWAMRQIPVGFVEDNVNLFIAAGSEIDPEVLLDEIRRVTAAGYTLKGRFFVHPSCTIITERHRDQETASDLVGRVGSTGKGIGAARADRIMRTALTIEDPRIKSAWPEIFDHIELRRTENDIAYALGGDYPLAVVIEGTQGYGLGVHTASYPQTTSSDCRAIDFLAMAGVSPWDLADTDNLRVWVVVRPYPIRVAGNSGELKGETSWDDLGLKAERTTVTQKIRRVGAWDGDIVREAIQANGKRNVILALAMVDQVVPALANMTDVNKIDDLDDASGIALAEYLTMIGEAAPGIPIGNLGTGPASTMWVFVDKAGLPETPADEVLEAEVVGE